MTMALVRQLAQPLPPRLREDVLGYVRSVDEALDEIFREARVTPTADIRSAVLVLAAARKLHATVSSTNVVLTSTVALFQSAGMSTVQSGSLLISRDSPFYVRMQRLGQDINDLLRTLELDDLVELVSYADVVRRLSVRL